MKKLSIALDEQVAANAARAAEARDMSLSAWLNEAAAKALAVQDGLAAVREWEAEHGELTAQELASADEQLDRLGLRRRS